MLGSPGNSVPGRHWRGVLWHLGLPRRQGLRTPRRSGTGLPAASGGALRAGGPTAVAAAPGAELPGPQQWLVGGFKHFFDFPFHILYWMSSFPLTNSIIFQDGYCTTNLMVILSGLFRMFFPRKMEMDIGHPLTRVHQEENRCEFTVETRQLKTSAELKACLFNSLDEGAGR